VGTMLLQLAKRAGATVLGTVGSDDKIDTAKRFGADQVINYQRENFADAVRALTGGRGVDVVIDGVGAATCRDDVKALRPFGRLVSFGRASGPAQLTGDDLQPKSLQWSHLGVFTAYPHITESYPWDKAPEAHRRLEGRQTQGKLALVHSN
jgi:NADPH:quinone reductase